MHLGNTLADCQGMADAAQRRRTAALPRGPERVCHATYTVQPRTGNLTDWLQRHQNVLALPCSGHQGSDTAVLPGHG